MFQSYYPVFLFLSLVPAFVAQGQTVQDDFEGNGTITSWLGDNCAMDINHVNPYQQERNQSSRVMSYHDTGGQYANVRFDVPGIFDLTVHHTFSLKVYVPSSGVTGNQPNQVSLKLQDGNLGQPWVTQSEIIKPISLNQWVTVSFNFKTDSYINLDKSSLPPTLRNDFNRVVIQVNGENNNDHVLAYIDDVSYDGMLVLDEEAVDDQGAIVFDSLVWSDEFADDGALSMENWFHQTQLPSGGSWYNGEIQHYTNRVENSHIKNGIMNLIAKRESYSDQGYTKQYTSARLNSKFTFQYGRVDIRAKLPEGIGTWPAIWMLGKNISESGAYWETQGFGTTPWPNCGEIDIMEHWGDNQNFVQSAIHTPSSFGGTVNKGGRILSTASDEFHLYTLNWHKEKLEFSVDSVVYYTYQPATRNQDTWPFDAELYVIFNLAILSNIDPDFREDTLAIDYIRIYQESTKKVDENETEEEKGEENDNDEADRGGEENDPGTVTAVDGEDKTRPLFYPNPMSDQITLFLQESAPEYVAVVIQDVTGASVKADKHPVRNNEVRVDGLDILPSGLYLITYSWNGDSRQIKFVKN